MDCNENDMVSGFNEQFKGTCCKCDEYGQQPDLLKLGGTPMKEYYYFGTGKVYFLHNCHICQILEGFFDIEKLMAVNKTDAILPPPCQLEILLKFTPSHSLKAPPKSCWQYVLPCDTPSNRPLSVLCRGLYKVVFGDLLGQPRILQSAALLAGKKSKKSNKYLAAWWTCLIKW